jgi:mono/diheme cytochrome c family protein
MSRWVKIPLYVVGSLVGLVALSAAGLYASSSMKIGKTYDVPLKDITVPTDSATIARGKHLVEAIGKCQDCHGEDLGGQIFIDDPGLGRISASNLTKGGVGGEYTDAEFLRALRHGVKRDGHGARIMPSEDWQYLADDDAAAIIAYVRSVPAVTRELPPFELRPVGRALVGAGILPMIKVDDIDHTRVHPKTMPADTSLEYGRYLADIGGCTGCHGPGLSGGKIPGTPPEFPAAANITPSGIGHYSDAELEAILRTGMKPGGVKVDDFMPWRATAKMDSVEMRATIKFLRSVPKREFGNR